MRELFIGKRTAKETVNRETFVFSHHRSRPRIAAGCGTRRNAITHEREGGGGRERGEKGERRETRGDAAQCAKFVTRAPLLAYRRDTPLLGDIRARFTIYRAHKYPSSIESFFQSQEYSRPRCISCREITRISRI